MRIIYFAGFYSRLRNRFGGQVVRSHIQPLTFEGSEFDSRGCQTLSYGHSWRSSGDYSLRGPSGHVLGHQNGAVSRFLFVLAIKLQVLPFVMSGEGFCSCFTFTCTMVFAMRCFN